MAFEIVFAPEAVNDFKALDGNLKATTRRGIETHLTHEPGKISKSRIKRLQGLRQPQFRLRIDQVRVFYDINEEEKRVEVLRILPKHLTWQYLEIEGIPDDEIPPSDES